MNRNNNCNRHSLGRLRANPNQSNPKAPVATGEMIIQRSTLMEICQQLEASNSATVAANLAAWWNSDKQGQYLTVQLSAAASRKTAPPSPTLFHFFTPPSHHECGDDPDDEDEDRYRFR